MSAKIGDAHAPKSDEALRCFSESYEEARAKFKEAAKHAEAEQHELEVCKDEDSRYTMDIAVLRGSLPCVVVVSSGTHGVEGYAGSAIQISILNKVKSAPVKPTVVLIHAVNPFGMAHFRRWNENNVDLNRNALMPRHFDQLTKADGLQETYMRFDSVFNPRSAPGCFYIHVGVWLDMIYRIARNGLHAMKMALVAATYSQSKGVFFGGRELQTSHSLVRDFMTRHFSDTKASDVAWVDVHTGLGPSGIDVLMRGTEDPDFEKLFPKIPGVCDGVQGFVTASTDEKLKVRCQSGAQKAAADTAAAGGPVSQSAGYEMTVGVLGRAEWINQFFRPNSGDARVITQEFGTVSNLMVARALFLENAGFNWDRENHSYWRNFTRDAFYVRTTKWKQSVLMRGNDVFEKLVGKVEKNFAPGP